MPVGGNALYIASKNFLETTISSLAKHFKTNTNEIKYKSGVFTFKNKSVSLSGLTQLFEKNDLEVNADWTPSPGTYTFPNGTHICELEIDKYLGTIKIIRYTIVDDFGKVINPLLLEGQVHGGIAQGIGQALFDYL